MDVRNLEASAAFITKDGSEIRELLAHRNSVIRNQSLAEARLPVGGSTQEHYHALGVLLAAALALCGCAHEKTTAGASPVPAGAPASGPLTNAVPEPIVTPETGLAGKVASFNNPGRFVVLKFPIGQMPAAEQHLFVYRQGLKVGEIKISGPQRDDLVVADLLAGEAQSGDDVRDK